MLSVMLIRESVLTTHEHLNNYAALWFEVMNKEQQHFDRLVSCFSISSQRYSEVKNVGNI